MHDDYPLAPEKREISHDMLLNYCSNIANKYDIKIGGINELVPNLGSKSKYVLHHKNLQLNLLLGMKLVKVHRILKFNQSDWLKNTLILIQVKEENAGNSFEKYFFRLVNNSTIGKAIGNLRKRINVRLVNNAKDYIEYTTSQVLFNRRYFIKYLLLFMTLNQFEHLINQSI